VPFLKSKTASTKFVAMGIFKVKCVQSVKKTAPIGPVFLIATFCIGSTLQSV
jgi:hypothetical protein